MLLRLEYKCNNLSAVLVASIKWAYSVCAGHGHLFYSSGAFNRLKPEKV
jgi:hypothetical protein